MSEAVAVGLVAVVEIYVALGFFFAIVFVVRGVGRIDPQATEGSWGFRALIVPGVTALWPILLRRWWRGSPPPIERNAHRDRAVVAAQAVGPTKASPAERSPVAESPPQSGASW